MDCFNRKKFFEPFAQIQEKIVLANTSQQTNKVTKYHNPNSMRVSIR